MSLVLQKRLTSPHQPGDGGGVVGSSTFDAQGRWTPLKVNGFITDAEWAGLTLNKWIEWGSAVGTAGSTALESQLSPPWGAAPGYIDYGTNTLARGHYGAFTGAGFDYTNGRFYHFGGGHFDSSNNMLTEFDSAKGTHRVVILPTHPNQMPSTYPAEGAAGGYSGVNYYPGPRNYFYFPSAETPAGNNAPTASHEWSGIVFVPGASPKVLLARFGFFEADINTGTWLGPPQGVATRTDLIPRFSICFHAHYLAAGTYGGINHPTGRVYLTGDGTGFDPDANFQMIPYDPVARTEGTSIACQHENYRASTCVDANGLWRYFARKDSDGTAVVSTVRLPDGGNLGNAVVCTGRTPDWDEGDNPVEYVPDINKILMWCTRSRAGGAQAGEMLQFTPAGSPAGGSFSLFTMSGTPPAAVPLMNNKMRYWSAKKVMIFKRATNLNAYVIRLA